MFSRYILYLSETLRGSYHRPTRWPHDRNCNFVPRRTAYRIQRVLRVLSRRDCREPLFTPACVRSSFYKGIKASLSLAAFSRARARTAEAALKVVRVMRADMQTDSRYRFSVPSRRTRCSHTQRREIA